jgi:hypothetical protein
MFIKPLNPDKPDDLRRCHAFYTMQRNKLIDERSAIENLIKASAEFKQMKERGKQLEKQIAAYRKKTSEMTAVVWDRFLQRKYDHQSESPYYDKTSMFDNTNIHPHVLDAISSVAPLSKLTPENIRDAVIKMARKALSEDTKLKEMHEKVSVLDREQSAIWARERELTRTDRINELDSRIYELHRELDTIADMLANPNKYKRRESVAKARESVELNIDKIYSNFKEKEAKAVY